MTGEKIRAVRKDHKPRKKENILKSYEETANVTEMVTSSTTVDTERTNIANRIFHNHNKPLKSLQLPENHSQINGNVNTDTSIGVIVDDNRNPIILTSGDTEFPVHECVFKGDVRRLSSLIRTQNISQKDVHGEYDGGYNPCKQSILGKCNASCPDVFFF